MVVGVSDLSKSPLKLSFVFVFFSFPHFSRDDVLTWLNDSLLPWLLDDSVLLRDTGSVLLGTPRLRRLRDKHGETDFTFSEGGCVF